MWANDSGVSVLRNVLFNFPPRRCRNIEQKNAALSANWTEESVGYLHDFVDSMFKGDLLASRYIITGVHLIHHLGFAVSLAMEEQTLRLRDGPYVLKKAPGGDDLAPNDHRVLRVASKIMRCAYILDPTAAAYRRQPCLSLNKFHRFCIQDPPQKRKFGTQKTLLKDLASNMGTARLSYGIHWLGVRGLWMGVRNWSRSSDVALRDLIRLNDEDFAREQRSLLAHIRIALQGFRHSRECKEGVDKSIRFDQVRSFQH